MARNILLRFDANEELIKIIDETAKKLGIANSALARLALFEYCKQLLNENGIANKSKSGD